MGMAARRASTRRLTPGPSTAAWPQPGDRPAHRQKAIATLTPSVAIADCASRDPPSACGWRNPTPPLPAHNCGSERIRVLRIVSARFQ